MKIEFKGTPGPWKVVHSASKDAWNVVGTKLGDRFKIAQCPYIKMEFITVDEDQCKANATLISKAPDMLEMLRKAQIELGRIRRSMSAHPDCTDGSEFDDYTTSAQQTEDLIENLLKEAACTN